MCWWLWMFVYVLLSNLVVKKSHGYLITAGTSRTLHSHIFRNNNKDSIVIMASTSSSSRSTSSSSDVASLLSWSELQDQVGTTAVGKALNNESQLRLQGKGSAHVQNKIRTFDQQDEPMITLFRDHAGWCPYCQKTMLLIEEKQVPVKIELVPMRSYGDKPEEFLQKVPNGLLPAIEVNGKIVTESSVIMELLDRWHPIEDGYKPMMPADDDTKGQTRYRILADLERDLFRWWCTLVFRPDDMMSSSGGGGILSNILGGGKSSTDGNMSSSMKGFLDCIRKVDAQLLSTSGPWFYDEHDYPTMIDFVYVSHVERMLASCAYWKGLDLRDPKWNLKGINNWLVAFEKREPYLAFKSDYFTHIKDIPPQYGPGYDGGFDTDREIFYKNILGRDGSWTLPLSHDDALQPLYEGIPLPSCVLNSVDILPDSDGSFKSCDPTTMAIACRTMAAWKLASNGMNVAKFASRGGPKGSKNVRKSFQAQLADPYAEPDIEIQPTVDAALRVICAALMDTSDVIPSTSYSLSLTNIVPGDQVDGVIASLKYLRERIGVPRDLPLAAARYLRAYLNWGIDVLNQ